MLRIRIVSLCLSAVLALSACQDKSPGITPPPTNGTKVAALTVAPSSSFLQLGQDRTLVVEARDTSGALVSNVTVMWKSDAPAVASVSAAGVVSALTTGTAHITASVGTVATTIDIGVTALAPGVAQWRLSRTGFTDATLLGVWDDGAGTTWAVGQQGAIMRSVNGSAWEIVPSGVTISLLGVWGSSPTDIWAAGEAGTILHYNGATWQKVAGSPNVTLLEIWGLAANDVYALGDQGIVLHWDGRSVLRAKHRREF